jgi:coenzyme PQQ precursor peptide PqqA
LRLPARRASLRRRSPDAERDTEDPMKRVWNKPVVTEKPAGMEVTAYLSAK